MPIIEQSTTDNEVAEVLRPYVQHGMDLFGTGKERTAECPFCSREGKFSVSAETGQWRCFSCGGGLEKGGGGLNDFLRLLWETSDKGTTSAHYAQLAKEIGLQFPETVMQAGLAVSVLTGNWLIPGYDYNNEGVMELRQLYIYTKVGDRMACLATKGRGHCLLGLPRITKDVLEVQVCEGFKDWLAWTEALTHTKIDEENELHNTANPESSLAAGVAVCAASTCSAFPKLPGKVFKGKLVTFLYDNDHPRTHKTTGAVIPPPGPEGMKRDTLKVMDADNVRYLKWGENGYDIALPNGYDLRDMITRQDRFDGIAHILNRLEDVPAEWRVKETNTAAGGVDISPKKCTDWRTLRMAWRKAMKWTDGLEHALVSMLACAASTNCLGDQLWLKIIGPASCGKTTLCDAVTVARKYVYAKSTIRGFHSGYIDSKSNEDNSLIVKIKGKTLITKDGDTLLQSPNLGQILSEARDVYDGSSRTHYRNQTGKDYEGIRTTWLLCGTSSLRKIDSSELGERFLDIVIMHSIDEDLEDEILWRKINQADRLAGIEATEELSSHHAPEMLEAMQLTGGYVEWLRENAGTKMSEITMNEWAKMQCKHIAKFVAYLRARPSLHQDENSERELAARLASVHVRYAKFVAFTLNKTTVDDEVIERTRRAATDTARGTSLDIVKLIYETEGGVGRTFESIHLNTNMEKGKLYNLLRFMRGIGILTERSDTGGSRKAWHLTKKLTELYREVMAPDANEE